MTQKICAWDIGIKHLAYCILESNIIGERPSLSKSVQQKKLLDVKTSSSKENLEDKKDKEAKFIKILEWENIDLTDEKKNQKKCCGTLKNGNKCNSLAKYKSYSIMKESDIDNSSCENYYCEKHKNNQINILDLEKEIKIINGDQENKCVHIINKNNCKNQVKYSLRNEYGCEKHKKKLIETIIKKYKPQNIKKEKSLNSNPQLLCEQIYKKLNEINYLKEVDSVYIENQPSFKNPVMKTVSTFVFSYFVNLFINSKNKIIKFVSPSYKIKINQELLKKCNDKIIDHNNKQPKKDCKCNLCKLKMEIDNNNQQFKEEYEKYKFNYDSIKELGIIYTEYILEQNKLTNFDKIKNINKKDDLCDAFLHGYRQLINKSIK